jgi:hypothetical protein
MVGSEEFQTQAPEGFVHSYFLGKSMPDGEKRLHIDMPWPGGVGDRMQAKKEQDRLQVRRGMLRVIAAYL